MKAQNLYLTLGVAENATLDEIKSAYRILAKKHHPDLNNGSAVSADIFKKVTAAFEVLGDPAKRAAYDRDLREERDAAQARAAAERAAVAARDAAAREAAARAEAAGEAAARAAATSRFRQQQPFTPVPQAAIPPVRRPAGPTPGEILGGVAVGVGLFAVLAAAFGGSSSTWDSSVGRYRGSDGKFTSG